MLLMFARLLLPLLRSLPRKSLLLRLLLLKPLRRRPLLSPLRRRKLSVLSFDIK